MKRRACGAILAGGVALLACAGSDVTGGSDALEVSVALSANQVVAGEELLVTVRAENASSRVLFPDLGPCVLTFEVLDTDNAVVTAGQPCPLVQWVGRLEPGDAYQFTFAWHGETGAAPQDFLPAGSYKVRGILDLRSGPVTSGAVPVELSWSSP